MALFPAAPDDVPPPPANVGNESCIRADFANRIVSLIRDVHIAGRIELDVVDAVKPDSAGCGQVPSPPFVLGAVSRHKVDIARSR